MNRRINRFEQICQNNSLEDYYGINNNDDTTLKIKHIRREMNRIELNISFKKHQYYDFKDLPREINIIISQYTTSFINIRLEIFFPEDYPFTPPNYSLVNVQHNISNSPINLDEYYEYIINKHNNEKFNSQNWSPAIEIAPDILEFIQKINHFEYIVE